VIPDIDVTAVRAGTFSMPYYDKVKAASRKMIVCFNITRFGDRLGDGSGRVSSDLMEKSTSMMECMMHLMTDLGMDAGGRVRI
jgi:hypothetical protein